MSAAGVMMQYFHWYLRPEDQLWARVKAEAGGLAQAGFSALWLPPPYKGTGVNDVGYGPYDLYDLGEFDQKGTVRTKYGTRQEYLEAVGEAHRQGVQVYADVVFNHKAGPDDWEEVEATKMAAADRSHALGREVIEAPTVFRFPGRAGRYSPMTWNWRHFDAVDFNRRRPEDGNKFIYLLKDKSFDPEVGQTFGNYDYLMGTDLDMENPEVCEELKRWGAWLLAQTHVDGLRFDAVKHVRASFFGEWLDHVAASAAGRQLYAFGEYWDADLSRLTAFIDRTGGRIALVDVPLHFNFHRASQSSGQFDMSKLLEGTLVAARPTVAVTFVDNHDTQPLQSLESFVQPWFKPLAYAVILLREQGYPCVFYLDYYGGTYADRGVTVEAPSLKAVIDLLLEVRSKYAHGPQHDYLDHHDLVGWTRVGDDRHKKALAVIMSGGPAGSKWMNVERRGGRFVDLTGSVGEPVTTNQDGFGHFPVRGGSLSVWVEQ